MKKSAVFFILAVVGIITGFILLYNGIIWFNNPDPNIYSVRGIDISAHQNTIDWGLAKSNHIRFIFIKATEGKDFKDRMFMTNWMNARAQGYIVGAYHFFTFRSKGIEQASNFISTVKKEKNTLAPVIDLEFGGNSKTAPGKEILRKELNDCIKAIRGCYGTNPILYVTYDSYEKYIAGGYPDNPIWIRDIFRQPQMTDNRKWAFWQYSNRGRIKGIHGFVDLNVLNKDAADILDFVIK